MVAADDELGVCGHCGFLARGFAGVGGVRLCRPGHGGADCYQLVTIYGSPLLDGRIWTPSGWRGI